MYNLLTAVGHLPQRPLKKGPRDVHNFKIQKPFDEP